MSNMNKFFTQLGTNAALLEAYKLDPRGIMKANGLTKEEIEAVMSGDKAQVSKLSGDKEMSMYLLVVNPTE
ncbi:hypothetical protein [Shewanella polaris]|uniref:Extradiol ring-cleavage dioxygenase LigAB LigA subunit domain-containing protein n=1 Tax=Shewanella polaris TaxID=2588449 RepID=A0A4Y5YGY9_9GAMM|nr:hypothetical protein [Shewanella polaris]QDE32070.1 hypothetical protein FH971_14530 [Shewanella polaris]